MKASVLATWTPSSGPLVPLRHSILSRVLVSNSAESSPSLETAQRLFAEASFKFLDPHHIQLDSESLLPRWFHNIDPLSISCHSCAHHLKPASHLTDFALVSP